MHQYAINILMLLSELYDEQLVEGPWTDALKRLAMAGTVATGIGTAGISAYNAQKSPEPATAVAQIPQFQQTNIKAEPVAVKPEKNINPNFPKSLADVDKLQPNARVETFVKTLLPMVQAENNKILQDRRRLIQDIKILKNGKKLPNEENTWVRGLVEKYGEDNLYELVKKVDIIPPSIALAQAGIESSWGTDPKTISSNAFYGQKSWAKSGGVEGPYGERYRAFETPNQSIAAYMTNLNTHNAYDGFRAARAELRKSGQPVVGLQLVPKLVAYTDTGSQYPKKLKSIIQGRNLGQYDSKK